MQLMQIPKLPVLCGDEAVEALKSYIEEIQEQRFEGLSDRQTKTLIRFALGLISTIEGTPPLICKDNEETHLMERIKNAVKRHIPDSAMKLDPEVQSTPFSRPAVIV